MRAAAKQKGFGKFTSACYQLQEMRKKLLKRKVKKNTKTDNRNTEP